MFSVIFWIVIHGLTCLLLLYADDEVKLDEDIVLKMPSVLDLDKSASIETIKKYTEKTICPSFHYFKLWEELKPDRDAARILPAFLLQSSSFAMIVLYISRHLCKLGYFESATRIREGISVFIVVLICVPLYFLAFKIYERRFSLPVYSEKENDLKERFKNAIQDISVSHDRAFQNFVILERYQYLCEVEYSLRRRKSLYKICGYLGVIIYFLFFMSIGR